MKKIATRKLVVERETLKTLLTEVPGGRLRDAQGGYVAPVLDPGQPSFGEWCSEFPACNSIVKTHK